MTQIEQINKIENLHHPINLREIKKNTSFFYCKNHISKELPSSCA